MNRLERRVSRGVSVPRLWTRRRNVLVPHLPREPPVDINLMEIQREFEVNVANFVVPERLFGPYLEFRFHFPGLWTYRLLR